MATLKLFPCMAIDALCCLEYLNDHKFTSLPEQEIFSEKINKLTSGKLKNGGLGKTNICLIVTSYYRENIEFENLTLENLAEFFFNTKNIYDEIIKSWSKNYSDYEKILEEMQFDKMWESELLSIAENYKNYINILKEIQFEKLWCSDLLPIIQREIKKKEEKYKNLNIDGILTDVQKLKQCNHFEDVKIYVSLMTYPNALHLHDNSFLDSLQHNMDVAVICHELMHGFTNTKLENLYLNYVKSNGYLTEQHNRLINEHHSGNEEEFVDAAEYYLRLRHNSEDKKDLLREAKERYDGCLPMSVFLFDLLSQETDTPNGYVQWLTNVFKNTKLPQEDIEKHLDNIGAIQ